MIGELHQLSRKEAAGPGRRAARAVLARRRRRPGDLGLLRRHAPPARPRRHPRRPTRRCCSSTSPPPGLDPRARIELWARARRPRRPGRHASCSPPSTSRRPTGSPTTSWSSTTGRIIAQGDARSLKRQVGGDHIARRRASTPPTSPTVADLLAPGHRRAAHRRRAGPLGQRAHQRRGRGRRRTWPDALADAGIDVDDLGLRQPTPRRGVPHPHRPPTPRTKASTTSPRSVASA